MNALAVKLTPITHGWKIELSDGREVARFTGPGAKRRAFHCLATQNVVADAGDRH